ncbi:MAG TPA: kelch repeat-containing protein [Fimbriimonas sp.]|nr:kelch repeat-containing protein [Fimbriimonas sp.]
MPETAALRRYMAAAVTLPDGRMMLTGGYDRPWKEKAAPQPLNTVLLLSPGESRWYAGPTMNLARARHAAVVLPDGRVLVIGGYSQNATASVELYDPHQETWTFIDPLDQPRYDHVATTDGRFVYVVGGSSQSMLSGVEVIPVDRSAIVSQP